MLDREEFIAYTLNLTLGMCNIAVGVVRIDMLSILNISVGIWCIIRAVEIWKQRK